MATSPVASMLLELLVDELEPSQLVVSTYGIREGLLYSQLKPRDRQLDPLIEEARDAGGGEHRFGQHGDLLDAWIAPLFDDAPAMRRLRLASCLLADVAWQANAGFRADRGIEMALHGNWVAVSPAGRVIMAQALSPSFGRDRLPDPRLAAIVQGGALKRAHCWGLAMRLGQRLSGGVGSVLKRTSLGTREWRGPAQRPPWRRSAGRRPGRAPPAPPSGGARSRARDRHHLAGVAFRTRPG